jgi:cation diffusion facilitator CzcD-associated flavoprotein CzcO
MRTRRAARTPSVAIIGTGFGGLGMAIRLKQAGLKDIAVFERAGDVGGTWRENTYPGAACDVPSHLYAFSFEAKADWTRRFATQPEILDYLRHCADKYDIRRHIRFNSEVLGAGFDEAAGMWTLALSDGSSHRATVLVSACGQLNRPAIPKIAGIDTFRGEMFHSANWNHDYDLSGQRVAVIGTGASAIQFVPQIAPRVASVTLFQRQPPHVLPKPDYPYRPKTVAAFRTVPGLLSASRIATYWTLEPRALAFTKFPQLMSYIDRRFQLNIGNQIADESLRETLTPKYKIGCKRILLSNDYYKALVRPNVCVVTDGIAEIRPTGLVTRDGRLHEADAIVLGTGFHATDFLAPMEITGRGGQTLNEAWRDGAEAYLGMTVSGFPNLFILYGPNTNLSHNSIVFMLEAQIGYVLQAVDRLQRRPARWLEVRADVQSEFNTGIRERVKATVWDSGCTSWYKTEAGKNTNNWPGFTFAYRSQVRRLRDAAFHFERETTPAVHDNLGRKLSSG